MRPLREYSIVGEFHWPAVSAAPEVTHTLVLPPFVAVDSLDALAVGATRLEERSAGQLGELVEVRVASVEERVAGGDDDTTGGTTQAE